MLFVLYWERIVLACVAQSIFVAEICTHFIGFPGSNGVFARSALETENVSIDVESESIVCIAFCGKSVFAAVFSGEVVRFSVSCCLVLMICCADLVISGLPVKLLVLKSAVVRIVLNFIHSKKKGKNLIKYTDFLREMQILKSKMG